MSSAIARTLVAVAGAPVGTPPATVSRPRTMLMVWIALSLVVREPSNGVPSPTTASAANGYHTAPPPKSRAKFASFRSTLSVIAAQPRVAAAVVCGALGYAVMTFVMTATPLAMRHHGHVFSDTSFVIQWHVLGMFAPSFFTGHIIARIGVLKTLALGVAAALACVIINLTGQAVAHFWLALTLLGIGWNFLFIGATTLLTKTYEPMEAFKTQALNDFIVFSTVAAAALSAGAIHHHYGWQTINYAALPALAVIAAAVAWLALRERNGVMPVDPLSAKTAERP